MDANFILYVKDQARSREFYALVSGLAGDYLIVAVPAACGLDRDGHAPGFAAKLG